MPPPTKKKEEEEEEEVDDDMMLLDETLVETRKILFEHVAVGPRCGHRRVRVAATSQQEGPSECPRHVHGVSLRAVARKYRAICVG